MSLETFYKSLISSPGKWVLYPFSILYGMILRLKKYLQKKPKPLAGIKVISIGNLDFGGSGKTPLTLLLLDLLKHQPICIITRGYRSLLEHKGSTSITQDTPLKNPAFEIGDEPSLFLQKHPHVPLFVGKDRLKGLKMAQKKGCQIALLDDGAQNQCVHKDIDVLLLDPDEPIKWLCPMGYRRDTLDTLKKADFVFFPYVKTEKAYQNAASQIKKHTQAMTVGLKANVVLELPSQEIALLTAIAKPKRLIAQLKELGFHIKYERILNDHAYFSPSFLQEFMEKAKKKSVQNFVCTEKDFVKLPPLYQNIFIPIKLVLQPCFDLHNWETFIGKIQKIP